MSGEIQQIPLAEIMRSPFNRDRSVEAKTEEWKEFVGSIRTHGVIQPIVVRPLPSVWDFPTNAAGLILGSCRTGKSETPQLNPRYELVVGEGRWLASSEAGLITVPAIVRVLSDREAIELQTIENDKRKDLDPIQKAAKYRQLLEEYRKEPLWAEQAMERLCQKLNKKASTVYEALRLLELPSDIQQAVQSGDLPPAHAGLLSKVKDPATREYLLEESCGPEGMSYRELAAAIVPKKKARTSARGKTAPNPAAKFHAVAEQLYPCLCNHCKRAFQMLARGETPRALRASGKGARKGAKA